MLRRVALVRTDVSEELSPSIIRVTGIGELGTTLVRASVVPSSPSLVTLMKEVLVSSETTVLTRATRRKITEDTSLYINRVRTSQETHYVTATETNRLMLCKISGFHGGDYEKCRLVEYKNPVYN
jgi:hypothetical protein